jgi:hypothetical protein
MPKLRHEEFASGFAVGKVQGNREVLAALQNEFGFGFDNGKSPYKIIFSDSGMNLVSSETNGVKTVRLLMRKNSN